LFDLRDPIQPTTLLCAYFVLFTLTGWLIRFEWSRGAKSNERRMAAIGFATFLYSLFSGFGAARICGRSLLGTSYSFRLDSRTSGDPVRS
jgi:hypothetical protein